jgi:hypothetical protein
MATIQNSYRDRSPGVRIIGATASNNAYPYVAMANMTLSGTKRNLVAGEGWTDEQVGLPHGYRSGYTWLLPQKTGSLKSANEAQGTVTATFAIAGGKNATTTIEGVATLTVTGQLVVSGTATINGTATVTSNAFAALLAEATITGAATPTASITALGWGVTAINGAATVTATRYATGTLEAEITPFTELSPQSLASAVWAQALEAGYTAEEMMRVMSAALAGEVSGAGTATVTIRDIGDTTNRIVASVDGSGNRTAVTLDVD